MQIEPPPFDVPQPPQDASPIIDVPTFAKLRSYRGPATTAAVVARMTFGDGYGGLFAVDREDQSSEDDDLNIIVDFRSRRWRRISSDGGYREITAGAVVVGTNFDTLVGIRKTVGSATTVSVPAAAKAGKRFSVRDMKGDASANPITVTGSINGGTFYTIDVDYGGLDLIAIGPSTWRIVE